MAQNIVYLDFSLWYNCQDFARKLHPFTVAQKLIYVMLKKQGMVQRLTVVDNSNFSPTHLTVSLAFLMLASCRVLPSPDFKQRGVAWTFTWSYLCSCSWSTFSSL
jgi:hypothetical protein